MSLAEKIPMRNFRLLACALMLIGAIGCSKSDSSSSSSNSGGGKLRIAVIPKGTTHVFWKTVEAGAKKAGDELGVEVIWKGPLKEDDRAEEIKVVEQFTSEGVNGIVLAPLDREALASPVQAAMEKKIPVVIFDSALAGEPGKDFVSFVATNNRKGGQMAGEQLVKLLGGKGKVVLLRYAVGSASTEEREAGFLEVIKKNPDITMLVDNRYGNATVASAQDESMKMIDKLKEADGVFCPNESTTLGMLNALRANNLTGKIKFVGFDATPALVEALKNNECQALIAQDPGRMGYLGVKTCVAAIKGEKVEPVVDTGVKLVTQESLNDPEMKKFLNIQ
jgi:ribose transport system substrate-binding protein